VQLRELSDAVDVDKIALHDADDFADLVSAATIWIQGFWFATNRDHEASARAANFARETSNSSFALFCCAFAIPAGLKC